MATPKDAPNHFTAVHAESEKLARLDELFKYLYSIHACSIGTVFIKGEARQNYGETCIRLIQAARSHKEATWYDKESLNHWRELYWPGRHLYEMAEDYQPVFYALSELGKAGLQCIIECERNALLSSTKTNHLRSLKMVFQAFQTSSELTSTILFYQQRFGDDMPLDAFGPPGLLMSS